MHRWLLCTTSCYVLALVAMHHPRQLCTWLLFTIDGFYAPFLAAMYLDAMDYFVMDVISGAIAYMTQYYHNLSTSIKIQLKVGEVFLWCCPDCPHQMEVTGTISFLFIRGFPRSRKTNILGTLVLNPKHQHVLSLKVSIGVSICIIRGKSQETISCCEKLAVALPNINTSQLLQSCQGRKMSKIP